MAEFDLSERDSLFPSGMDAPRFVEFLVESNPAIASILLFHGSVRRPIQEDKAMTVHDQKLISDALTMREDIGLPFWDSIFLNLMQSTKIADKILDSATFHNAQDLESFSLDRDNCREIYLRNLISELPQDKFLIISSRMRSADGFMLHLPMLDFHCNVSAQNNVLVREIVRRLGLAGYVANSGRSYHFYGRAPVNEQELITFLGKALLFCPIIDRAWIAHQLIERACGLRISPGKNYAKCPEVLFKVCI